MGDQSILGHKSKVPFATQAEALLRRLTLLFDALDAPDVQRVDMAQSFDTAAGQIVPAGLSIYRQRRPMGPGFARAFLTPQHITVTGQSPAVFWKDLEARCAGATPEQIAGHYDWAVLHFRRGGPRLELEASTARKVVNIGYQAPPTA